jgi:hypothetical protein
MSKSKPARFCSQEGCKEVGDSTIKYFYEGKKIIMTPLTPKLEDGGLDLCVNHSKSYVAPKGWTLVNKLVMPSYLTQSSQNAKVESSGGEAFFGFIVIAIMIGVALLVGWQIILWLAEMDWGSDGTYIVQIPNKVRRP